jgi:uncharacterized UBP type Zn finger protein
LNAVFQALLGLPSFVNDLLTHWNTLESTWVDWGGLVQNFCLLVSFKEAGNQKGVSNAIEKFGKDMDKVLPHFEGFHMQDAHEFLVLFCDSLQVELTKIMSSLQENFVGPIEENFGFQLEETRTCCRCRHQTRKLKRDFVLRLDMPTESKEAKSEPWTIQTLFKKTMKGKLNYPCQVFEFAMRANLLKRPEIVQFRPLVF